MRVLEYLRAARGAGAPRQGRSIRFRLLAIALFPTLVILPLFLGITIIRWNDKFNSLLATKVNSDLTIAHQYFSRLVDNTGEHLQALRASARFRDAIDAGEGADLSALLEKNRVALKLDFLMIVDADGHVVAAAPPLSGVPAATHWPVVRAALSGAPATAIDVFSGRQLSAISPALARKAELELIPTPAAAPTTRTVETPGMVVHAACPVTLASGGHGALVGGILLNRNLAFIDAINDLVYRKASLPEGSEGTATLFLEDVRISTNVRLFQDTRALGTRVSGAVRSAVLDQGRTWLDSAFVVNDWYMSAYEPIVDSFGKRVGMLYVGFLLAPFTQAKYNTLITIIVAFLAVAAISVPVFLRWARGIFEPLERMTGTIARVESGDLGARTGPTATGDEIGRVADHLDGLLDQLQQRDRELRSWNEELNRRVAERTRELEGANRQLEATTRQLIVAEKLAAIGEITAGVAHEINNPIAVMQGNLEVVRSIMGERAAEAQTEFRLLDEQIHRITQIVTRLLQFAKPEEYAGYVELHTPGDVISDCLPLVEHLLGKSHIEVRRDDRATRFVSMNKTELQQVLVNLIVNAIHAMPEGGALTLASRDEDVRGRSGVVIEVSDTGIGMSEDVLRKIFDPFFTTKRDSGTGLGLSISQTLISRQDGTLTASSVPGRGTTFLVWLPEAS
ncbi:sensor histidine kinase [Ancylobacter mangrovi]|uniref:sensor histidine kinase n=1 Tax=Ancylobacter mangrovi TaxID=2972472 RepID=UPI002161F700|nr:cache domain-containing protein [Ancylobacter mangrovi]MCS0502018.1 cache domain-containing protein [Ancylobacter mangrovi]